MIFGSKQKQEYRDLCIKYKRVFGTEEGREVLFDLMNRYHILQAPLRDPILEGQRSVVVEIATKVNIKIETLDALMRGDLTAVTKEEKTG